MPALILSGGNAGVTLQGGGGSGVVGSPAAVARKTYNAGDFPGATPEGRITAMIARAHTDGASFGSIPEAWAGYDESLVTYFSDVQLGIENGVYQKGVYDARAYGGKTNAGMAIAKCIANLPSTGGTVDCRGFVGAQAITTDLFAGDTTEAPVVMRWGHATFTLGQAITGNVGTYMASNVTMILDGTTFKAADGTLMTKMFYSRRSSGIVSVTNGSTAATLISGPFANIGPVTGLAANKLMAIRYHKPRGGRDNTTLTADLLNNASVINVVSTTGFPASGDLLIGNSIIRYTGVNGTQFTGLTFAIDGTANPSTIAVNGADVDRPVYEKYVILSIVGSTITLDRAYAGPTATSASYFIGTIDVVFKGNGTLDGSKGGSDSAQNLEAIHADVSRRWRVGGGLRIIQCDHVGVNYVCCDSCYAAPTCEDIGWLNLHLGFGVVCIFNTSNCTVRGRYLRVGRAVACDDRSTTPTSFDNPSDNNDVQPSLIQDCDAGCMIEGSNGNYVHCPQILNWTQHGVSITNPQWITPGMVQDNTVIVGYSSPQANCIELTATLHQNNTLIARHPLSTLSLTGTDDDGFTAVGGKVMHRVGGANRFTSPASGTITFGDGIAVTGAITATGTIGVIGGVGITLGGGGQAKLNLDGVDATFAASEMGIGENSGNLVYSSRGSHAFRNATDGLTYFSISNAGVVSAVSAYQRGGVQVVAARKTGWAVWSGTSNRATKDTSTATLADVAQTLKALIDDLHGTAGHGLIGT